MNVRNAGVFALMFAASLLLLLPGCQGPLRPDAEAEVDAPGTGTVSLTVERLDLTRAIRPDIGLDDFDAFDVVFTRAGFDNVERLGLGADGGNLELNVELAVGEWTVRVDALYGGAVAATGTADVDVEPGTITPTSVILRPLVGDADIGTFAWILRFPGNVTAGYIHIVGGASISLPGGYGATGEWAGEFDLPAGDEYRVIITLENPAGMVMVDMNLHVFGNLTSSFEWDFVAGDFAEMGGPALAAAITVAQGILAGVSASEDGLGIPIGSFWATAADRAAFAGAIDAAQAVLDRAPPATAAELNVARRQLLDAQATFYNDARREGTYNPAVTAARNALSARVAQIASENLTAEGFTPETWALFSTALSNAQAAIANADATVVDLEAALASLNLARDGLEAVVTGPVLVGTPGTVLRTGVNIVLGDATGMATLLAGGHFGAVGTATMGARAGYVFAHNIPNNTSGLQVLPPGLANLQAGDMLRVTGRTTGTVANSRLELGHIGSAAGANVGEAAIHGGSIPPAFTFTYELTQADINAGLRIVPNSWGFGDGDQWVDRFTGFAFSIDDLIVFRPVVDHQVIFFNLNTNTAFQDLPPGTSQTGAIAGVGLYGNNATVTVYGYEGRNFLHVSGRSLNWHGLDITGLPAAGVQSIRATGRTSGDWQSGDGGNLQFQDGGSGPAIGIGGLNTGDMFTLTGTVNDGATSIRIAVNAWGGAGTEAERAGRLSFYVYSIIVGTDLFQPAAVPANTVNVEATENFWPPAGGGGDAGVAGEWQAVLASSYLSGRSATLTATLDGILVSGRGSGEHAHNNGLAFDLAGLRALNLGNGVIVFTGTAVAPITRKDTQGLAPNVQADVDGTARTFTMTIPVATTLAADVVDGQLWGGPAPFIGSNDLGGGEVPNFIITGITIGGVCIKALLAGYTPPPPYTLGDFIVFRGITAPAWITNGMGLGPAVSGADGGPLHFGDWNNTDSAEWVRHPSGAGVSLRVDGTGANFGVQFRGAGSLQPGDNLIVSGRAFGGAHTGEGTRAMVIVQSFDWGDISNQVNLPGTTGAGGTDFRLSLSINPTHLGADGVEIRVHNNAGATPITHFIIDDITVSRGDAGTVARRFEGFYPGGTRFANSGVGGRVNGFDYEAWTDHRGAEGFLMYIYGDGSFSGTWTQTYNTLFRVGRRWPGAIANPASFPTINEVGNISLRHRTTSFTSTNGATYLTIYGWAFDGNNQIEFYIVDSWRNFVPVYNDGRARAGYTHHGSFQSGGYTWDVVTGWRIGQPALTGQSVNFLQIFSVRRGSQLIGGTGARTSTINVSDHFNRWITNVPAQTQGGTTINFTGSSRLYEVMWCVEGFGGTARSSGSGIVTELCIIYGDYRVCTNPSTCPRC